MATARLIKISAGICGAAAVRWRRTVALKWILEVEETNMDTAVMTDLRECTRLVAPQTTSAAYCSARARLMVSLWEQLMGLVSSHTLKLQWLRRGPLLAASKFRWELRTGVNKRLYEYFCTKCFAYLVEISIKDSRWVLRKAASLWTHGKYCVHSTRTAMVDLGLSVPDGGLVPNGARCGVGRMCVDQVCTERADVAYPCRDIGDGDCGGVNRGVCNNNGHCHCAVGHAPPACLSLGYGGSVDSNPASIRATDEGATETLVFIDPAFQTQNAFPQEAVWIILVVLAVLGTTALAWVFRNKIREQSGQCRELLSFCFRYRQPQVDSMKGYKTLSTEESELDQPKPAAWRFAVRRESCPVGICLYWCDDVKTSFIFFPFLIGLF